MRPWTIRYSYAVVSAHAWLLDGCALTLVRRRLSPMCNTVAYEGEACALTLPAFEGKRFTGEQPFAVGRHHKIVLLQARHRSSATLSNSLHLVCVRRESEAIADPAACHCELNGLHI